MVQHIIRPQNGCCERLSIYYCIKLLNPEEGLDMLKPGDVALDRWVRGVSTLQGHIASYKGLDEPSGKSFDCLLV